MKTSNFLSINWQDFFKGLLMAVIGGVIAIIGPSIQAGNFVFDWPTIWHTALAAGIAYIAKMFFTPTPSTIQIDPTKTSVVDKATKVTIINSKY